MAEKAKPEAATETAGSGKKKKLIIIIAAALVLLIGIGAAVFFLVLKKPPSDDKANAEQAEVAAPAPPPTADVGPMVKIEEFIVNIISEGTPHYVKTTMSIELNNELAVEEVNKRMPQIRDAILLLIGNKTFEELQDLQGKKQLKAELKAKMNVFLKTGQVKEVYLTDFVVQ